MKIGFTGTRGGMTEKQYDALRHLMGSTHVDEAHHGDCVGSDFRFHYICLGLHIPVVIHPPAKPELRAWCEGAIELRRPKPYLGRDRDIVDDTGWLIATPKRMREEQHSGTWFTIHYARSLGRGIMIIWPDGSVTAEEPRRVADCSDYYPEDWS